MRLNTNRFGITAVVAILIISVVAGGTVAVTADDGAVSPDDISVTSHGADHYDDVARFEISNDADQDVTLSYASDRENGTVTIEAQSSENLTVDIPEFQGTDIALTKDGTTYAEARASIVPGSDLGPTNPDYRNVDIEPVRYDEDDGLIEYEIRNENERPVDGELSFAPIDADDSSITLSANDATTVIVEEDAEPDGPHFNTTARQLDLFENEEDNPEPGHPALHIARGEVTDDTPREEIDPSDGSNGADSDTDGDDSNGDGSTGSDGDDGPGEKPNCGCDADRGGDAGTDSSQAGGTNSDSSDGNSSGTDDVDGDELDDATGDEGTDSSTGDDDADESPGFGVLVALASIVGAAVLAERRPN